LEMMKQTLSTISVATWLVQICNLHPIAVDL
jgi:hypothetical protein